MQLLLFTGGLTLTAGNLFRHFGERRLPFFVCLFLSSVSTLLIWQLIANTLLIVQQLKPFPVLILVCAACYLTRSENSSSQRGWIGLSGAPLILVSLLGGKLIQGLTSLPADGDSIAYHIASAIRFMQTGAALSVDGFFWFYPANTEALAGSLLLFSNNLGLTTLPNIIYLALGAISAYTLVRSVSNRMPPAVAAALAVVCMPITYRFALNTLGTDVPLMSLFGSAVTLLHLLALKRFSELNNILFILYCGCLSMLMGTKYTGLPLTLLLFISLLFLARDKSVRHSLKQAANMRTAMLCTLLFFTLGISWYARNYYISGCAVFPVETPFDCAAPAFERYGSPPNNTSILQNVTNVAVWKHLFRAVRNWGGQTTVFALLVIFLMAWSKASIATEANSLQRKLMVLLVLATFLFLACPVVVENVSGTLNQIKSGISLRFGLPVLFLVHCICALRLDRCDNPRMVVGAAALWMLLSLTKIRSAFHDVSSGVVCLLLLAPLIAYLLYQKTSTKVCSRKAQTALTLASLFAVLQATSISATPDRVKWEKHFSVWFEQALNSPSNIVRRTQSFPENATVISSFNYCLPFCGPKLSRRIIETSPASIRDLAKNSPSTQSLYFISQRERYHYYFKSLPALVSAFPKVVFQDDWFTVRSGNVSTE